MKTTITVDVVSDVVCPWCFIGQKKLDLAVALLPDIDVTVNWRPYQLDPTIPKEGVDRQAYMLGKFGSIEKIEQGHRRIGAIGAELGIAFDFDAIKMAANTLDAHRLIRWAGVSGAEMQGRLVRSLFSANFEQGRNIGDPEVLVELAAATGMDGAVVATLLSSQSDVDAVQEEIATAARMGVTGVPCFLIDGRYALMGAQDPETLAEAIQQVPRYPV